MVHLFYENKIFFIFIVGKFMYSTCSITFTPEDDLPQLKEFGYAMQELHSEMKLISEAKEEVSSQPEEIEVS